MRVTQPESPPHPESATACERRESSSSSVPFYLLPSGGRAVRPACGDCNVQQSIDAPCMLFITFSKAAVL